MYASPIAPMKLLLRRTLHRSLILLSIIEFVAPPTVRVSLKLYRGTSLAKTGRNQIFVSGILFKKRVTLTAGQLIVRSLLWI